MLAVSSLGYRTARRWLFRDLSFDVLAGQALHIVGANGAGKTTMLRLLTGLEPVSAGAVCWFGQDRAHDDMLFRQQLFYLGHQIGLKEHLTVLENLQFDLRLSQARVLAEAKTVLADLSLGDVLHRLVARLSRGQKQRVALAKLALASQKIWVLDEPLTALDQAVIPVVQRMWAAHLVQGGVIVFTSHRPVTLPESRLQTLTLMGSIPIADVEMRGT